MSNEKGKGLRYNEGKTRHDLIPSFAQEQYAKVLTYANTKKANKVVLLQIDKKFVVEEYSNVEEALEDAKRAFQIYEGMKQAKAYVATVVEGYVKRDGVLNHEKVYVDLVEQLTINNIRKELKDE